MVNAPKGLEKMFLELSRNQNVDTSVSLSADVYKNFMRMLSISENVDEAILGVSHDGVREIFQKLKSAEPDDQGIYHLKISSEELILIDKVLEGVNVVDVDDFFHEEKDIPDDHTMQAITDAFTNFVTKMSPC